MDTLVVQELIVVANKSPETLCKLYSVRRSHNIFNFLLQHGRRSLVKQNDESRSTSEFH